MTGFQDDPRSYQVSVPVQPGNSGGVLADDRGNGLGILVHKLDTATTTMLTGDIPQNVNYAIKSSYVRLLIDTVPGLAEKLPSPTSSAVSFETAVEKVQAASALVLSFGQSD